MEKMTKDGSKFNMVRIIGGVSIVVGLVSYGLVWKAHNKKTEPEQLNQTNKELSVVEESLDSIVKNSDYPSEEVAKEYEELIHKMDSLLAVKNQLSHKQK